MWAKVEVAVGRGGACNERLRRFGCGAAVLLVGISLTGCRDQHIAGVAKTPSTQAATAPVPVDLSGTWTGTLPPSSTGSVTETGGDGKDLIYALLRVSKSDVSGSSGDLTLCSMHQAAKAGSFEHARVGTQAVPLDTKGTTLTLAGLAPDKAFLHTVLQTGGNLFAGNLQRGSDAGFRSRCTL